MLGIYFIAAAVLGILTGFIRIRNFSLIFLGFFLTIQYAITIYAFNNLGKTELNYFTFDSTGVLFLGVLTLLASATAFHGYFNLKHINNRKFSLYHASLIVLITAISGAYLANNITAAWIFTEATTLSVAVLIYHERTKVALEATWKYIFVCSTGIALAYIGILFISASLKTTGSIDLSYAALQNSLSSASPVYLKLAFIFILIGFSTKMGLFPVHTVTVDAHTVDPPQISALISTALMNVGFISIFRVFKVMSGSSVMPWMSNVLIISGTLSVLVAASYMLKVKHYKRMFAYSSLENMGIVAIALGIGGIGYYAAILHLVLHSFVKSSLFYQIGQAHELYKTYLIEKCSNYLKIYPAGAVALLLGFLGITAIPPSGMFISELMVFKQLVVNEKWALIIILALLLTVIIYAMAKRMMNLFFSESSDDNTEKIKIPAYQTITQYLFLGIVFYLCFVQADIVHQLIQGAISGIK